jgi:sugar/nucleoside kinase (ribokinase family)
MTSGGKRVLVAGELNVDLILQGYQVFPVPGKEVLVDDFLMTLGSASAICAMGLARLTAPVAFLGVVGDDPWGAYCVDTMRAAGIDVTRVAVESTIKTGVTVSLTAAHRDRALVSYLGSIAALEGGAIGDAALAGFDHLHMSSYFLQKKLRPSSASVFRRARAAGLTTSLDPGFDPSERWGADLRETLREVDLFFPNEVELHGIAGTSDVREGLERLQNGRTLTVAKLGPRGAAAIVEGRLLEVPAFPVQPVDTTGAGDSFDAGFLYAWLAGRPVAECLRWGAACGSLSTRGSGGTDHQASLAEAERLLAGRP